VGACYSTYFDAANHGPDWQFPAFGLLFVAIGAGLVLLGRMDPTKLGLPNWAGPPWQRIFPYIFLGFAVLWTTIASAGVFGGWVATWLAETRGQLAVVSGPIENFHPMPVDGHDTERFTVSNVHFEYSDYVVTSGFNQTSSHGGPIREGLLVRISYTGSQADATIAKLELACSQSNPSPSPN
jgi:hypothetical protein